MSNGQSQAKTVFPPFRVDRGRLDLLPDDGTAPADVKEALKRAAKAVLSKVRAQQADRFVSAYVPPSILDQFGDDLRYNHIRIGVAHLLGYSDLEVLLREIGATHAESDRSRQDVYSLEPLLIPPNGPLRYSDDASKLLLSGLHKHHGRNALLSGIDVVKGEILLSGDRHRPYSTALEWTGTEKELLDHEVLSRFRMPRPFVLGDYRGPCGHESYVKRRLELGIATDSALHALRNSAPGSALADLIDSEYAAQIARITNSINDGLDTIYFDHDRGVTRVASSIIEATAELEELLDAAESMDSALLGDVDVVLLEQLRYACWILRFLDTLPWLIDDQTYLAALGEAQPYVIFAVQLMSNSPDLIDTELGRIAAEYRGGSPTLPNAICYVPGFAWAGSYRGPMMSPRKEERS